MRGHLFTQFVPGAGDSDTPFENLLNIFSQLLSMNGGDVSEALSWMNELDNKYGFTSNAYGMGDFIDDLKEKGFINENPRGELSPSSKQGQKIKTDAFEEIFSKLRKNMPGGHKTTHIGTGDEQASDTRDFQFGDGFEQIALSESIRNAHINNGIEQFSINESDLLVQEREHKSQTSTVLMIDISHSMILYGEDRITPAKKVAMALGELITTRYPKDTLDVLVFGNDAWQVQLKDLPYLQVGPYYTNTVAGIELAMQILRRKKTLNKQIFMITDGKPTCIKEGGRYYRNSFGLDRKILTRTLNLGAQCLRQHIPVTTFMIASDPYLKEFVKEFTKINRGRAYYSDLDDLGSFVFEDYQQNKRKRMG
jgi:Ca-activated chloride channel homolog